MFHFYHIISIFQYSIIILLVVVLSLVVGVIVVVVVVVLRVGNGMRPRRTGQP